MFHFMVTLDFLGLGFITNTTDRMYGIHVLCFALVYHVGCTGEPNPTEHVL